MTPIQIHLASGNPHKAAEFQRLADDSGLCVTALGGAPGVYSARYAGEPKSDARNNDKLLAEIPAVIGSF